MTDVSQLPELTMGQGLAAVIGTILTAYIPFAIKALGGIREDLNENARKLTDELHKANLLYEKRLSRLEAIVQMLWAAKHGKIPEGDQHE